MSQISAVYFVILLFILLFGIISLPIRPKKARPFHNGESVVKEAMARPMSDTSSIALQQAAVGKEPPAYSVDQKTASVSQQAKGK